MSCIGYLKIKAVSNRATCPECKQKIAKGAPVVVLYHDYFGDRVQFHRSCIVRALSGQLVAAGRAVVSSWDGGDLAGAVRYLDAELSELTP